MVSPPSACPRWQARGPLIRMRDGLGIWVTVLIWKVDITITAVQVERQAKKT